MKRLMELLGEIRKLIPKDPIRARKRVVAADAEMDMMIRRDFSKQQQWILSIQKSIKTLRASAKDLSDKDLDMSVNHIEQMVMQLEALMRKELKEL